MTKSSALKFSDDKISKDKIPYDNIPSDKIPYDKIPYANLQLATCTTVADTLYWPTLARGKLKYTGVDPRFFCGGPLEKNRHTLK